MVSLSGEYKKLRDIGSDFITHAEWGARFNYSNSRSVIEPARQVFIHITVTEPNNYRSHAAHVRAIEAIGIARFGNTGMSYNRIILFGVNKPYIGQRMSRRGAHTVNDFGYSTCRRWGSQCPGNGGPLSTGGHGNNLNYTARAYAYGANTFHSVPDSVIDTFAPAIAADIKAGFVRRDARIHGHRCVSSKSCPGDKLWARMHDLRRRVDHYLDSDLEDDMSPRDWDSKDREAVRDIVESALRFPTIVTAPNDESWNTVHALSWLMSQSAAQRDGLARVLANQQAIMQSTGVEVDEAALASQIAATLVPAVIAALPDTGLTAEQVEQATETAVRNVLGSLDA